MFFQNHPNLRVWVAHGNTLTTIVIINEIHPDVKEVFLTGATSKLGLAISFYLCRKRVHVLVCSRNIIVLLHSVWIWLKMGVLLMCFFISPNHIQFFYSILLMGELLLYCNVSYVNFYNRMIFKQFRRRLQSNVKSSLFMLLSIK